MLSKREGGEYEPGGELTPIRLASLAFDTWGAPSWVPGLCLYAVDL